MNALNIIKARVVQLAVDESGMSTVEYSVVEYYTRKFSASKVA